MGGIDVRALIMAICTAVFMRQMYRLYVELCRLWRVKRGRNIEFAGYTEKQYKRMKEKEQEED